MDALKRQISVTFTFDQMYKKFMLNVLDGWMTAIHEILQRL